MNQPDEKIEAICSAKVASSGTTACAQERSLLDTRDPEHNFEVLWQTFDRNYALFGPKRIDWDALYRVYRPKVTPETTDEELFDVTSRLLGHLNDNHVTLSGDGRSFRSGILFEMNGDGFQQQEMEDFSIGLIEREIMLRVAKTRPCTAGSILA